jgi:sec-independent protein translocase protein TatC
MAIPFVVCSMALFILGALIAYWTLPKALGFLLGFAGPQLTSLLTADKFLSFVMLVALSFGLAFELPIVLSFLLAVGVVSTRQLRDWRRGAILGIALFAAIITPSSDPYTMLAMTIPMVLFYEGAIIVGRLMKR